MSVMMLHLKITFGLQTVRVRGRTSLHLHKRQKSEVKPPPVGIW